MNGEIVEHENPQAYQFWLKFWRIVIAGSQIASGLLGLYYVFFHASPGAGLLVFVLALSLFSLSTAAGILLARNMVLGFVLSFAAQALQIVHLSIPGLLFLYVCGPQLLIGFYNGLSSGDIGGGWSYLAYLVFQIGGPAVNAPPPGPDGFGTVPLGAITGINFVPALAVIALIFIRKAAKPKI